MDKILNFKRDKETYSKIAQKRMDDGDLIGALSCFFSSLKQEFSIDTVKDIAYVYSQINLYELSNKYWYLFLSKAPKNRVAEAYEGLGINYIFEEDLRTGNYYLGLISKKKLMDDDNPVEDDFIEKMSEYFSRTQKLKVVYPPESADYGEELFNGRFALANADYKKAIEFFSAVPKGCKQYNESREELATAYYLAGEFEKGVKVVKENIAEKGETLSDTCKLSQIYKAMAEEGENAKYYEEKAAYYYNKAKEIGDKNLSETFKLSFTAFEQRDDKTALRCMEKITADRKYDANMFFYYAVSLLNNGFIEKSYDTFNYARRIYPFSDVINYYADKVGEILRTGCDKDKIIPAKYRFAIPQKEADKRVKIITERELKKGGDRSGKDKKLLSYLKWGLYSNDKQIEDICAFFLMYSEYEEAIDLLKEKLLDVFADNDLKRSIVYYLIYLGENEKISCVVNKIFISIKPQKLKCGRTAGGDVFFAGYALAMPTLAFAGCKSLEKVGIIADDTFRKLSGLKPKIRLTREEACALIIYLCGFKGISEEESVCAILDVKQKTLKKLIAKYKGENDD